MDSDKQLTTRQFNKLLHMAVDKHGLDPKNTYVEITWWDNVFRPLNITDCNQNSSSNILVFGDNTIKREVQIGNGECYVRLEVDPAGRDWLCNALEENGFEADCEPEFDNPGSLWCWFHVSWGCEGEKE